MSQFYGLDTKKNEKCNHENAHIEKACCVVVSSSGYVDCACGGRDDIVCENAICPGIDDDEVLILFERLQGGGSDCDE